MIKDMQIKQYQNIINIVDSLFNKELITLISFCFNNVHN